jgi:ParB family chromosome partitioning protein
LRRALEKDESSRKMAVLVAALERFAVRKSEGTYKQKHIRIYRPGDDVAVPEDADIVKYCFDVPKYCNYALLYTEDLSAEENADKAAWDAEKDRNEKAARREALSELMKTAYSLRCDFVRGLSNAKAKKSMAVIMRYALEAAPFGGEISEATLTDVTGIEGEYIDSSYTNEFCELYADRPEYGLLITVYSMLDYPQLECFDWNNRYSESEDLNMVYAFLEGLGYEPSAEEKALLDGTHELFVRAEK